MKLGVMNPVLYQMGFKDACKYLQTLGVGAIEIGAGGYPGRKHFCPQELLPDEKKVLEYKKITDDCGLEISALSCHGNPIHPDKDEAKRYDSMFRDAILCAEILGIDTIVGFSGCPGDCEQSIRPNWVTCTWPTEYYQTLKWQWEEKLIPYWTEMAEFAKSHGIKKIAFEMHPGFMVYNPSSLLRLRAAVGDIIGANFDPSHLFWQGIEPAEAIRELSGAIYHFHAKDTAINERNCKINGVLNTTPDLPKAERSWMFRTVGYGHSKSEWCKIISALKLADYDGSISIEHEDSYMSAKEGLEKAVAFLKDVIIFEDPSQEWWL